MSFLTELLSFVIVGDARYGRERTPLDDLNEKAERGFNSVELRKKPAKTGQKRKP